MVYKGGNLIYIYDENLNKLDGDLPYTFRELDEMGLKIHDVDHRWKNTYWATDEYFKYPKIQNGKIVEKTQDELKLENIIPLSDGEIIEGGKLIIIEKPEGYRIIWDKSQWIESITQEELVDMRLKKMIKYSQVEENKARISSLKFHNESEILVLDDELNKLEVEINKISDYISILFN